MRRRLVLVLAAGMLAVAGCGDDDDDSGDEGAGAQTTASSEVSDQDRAAIEKGLTGYFGGDTAAKVCDWMTRGLQAQIAGRGEVSNPAEPADDKCEAEIDRATDEGKFSLEPSQPEAEEVAVTGKVAAARVAGVQDEPYPVFLVESGGKWLVHGEGEPPPNYEDLAAQVES